MKKIKKDIDKIFDGIYDKEIELPQSTFSIIEKLPSKKTKKEFEIMENKEQQAPRARWKVVTAISMAFVLVVGGAIGGFFLFRDNPDNSAAAQAFNEAISKMSEQDCVNISKDDTKKTYVYEKGSMVSIYSGNDEEEKWQNENMSIRRDKQADLYYKDSNTVQGELSLGIKKLLLGSSYEDEVSFKFKDNDNIIASVKGFDYTITLENKMIKSIAYKNGPDAKKADCNFKKNKDFYAPSGVVSIFIRAENDRFLSNLRNNLREMGLGVENTFFAEYNQARQIQQISSAIARGTDFLLVNMAEPDNTMAVQSIMYMAEDAGIPVIFFNEEISNELLNSYDFACYLGTSSKDSGITQGRLIAETLLNPNNITGNISKYASNDTYNGKSVIYYTMIRGEEGHMDADLRTYYSIVTAQAIITDIGFNWVLRPSPMITNTEFDLEAFEYYLGFSLTEEEKEIFKKAIPTNWTTEEAFNKFNSIFSASDLNNKDKLGIVICNNDNLAFGVIQYLRTCGYNLPNETNSNKVIPILGIDGDPAAFNLIDEGSMTGTVYMSIAYARIIVEVIENLTVGKDFLYGTGHNFIEGVNKLYIPFSFKLNLN